MWLAVKKLCISAYLRGGAEESCPLGTPEIIHELDGWATSHRRAHDMPSIVTRITCKAPAVPEDNKITRGTQRWNNLRSIKFSDGFLHVVCTPTMDYRAHPRFSCRPRWHSVLYNPYSCLFPVVVAYCRRCAWGISGAAKDQHHLPTTVR